MAYTHRSHVEQLTDFVHPQHTGRLTQLGTACAAADTDATVVPYGPYCALQFLERQVANAAVQLHALGCCQHNCWTACVARPRI